MKILLLNTNKFLPKIPPLGLEYISNNLYNNGFDNEIFDNPNTKIILAKIEKLKPDFIGLTLRNIDNCHLLSSVSTKSPINDLACLIEQIRTVSDAYIILGGAGFSIAPQLIFKKVKPDFGVIGEGEQVLVDLIKNIKTPDKVSNLIYLQENRLVITKNETCNIDNFRTYKRTFIDHKKYIKNINNPKVHNIFNIQTKRGCNNNCIYCAEPNVIGTRIRKRSIDKIIGELENLVAQGITKKIFITDSEFNVCNEHAYAVAKAILDSKLDIEWTCYMTPDGVNEDLIEIMKKAGCYNITWSFESASDKVLINLGKKYSVKDIINVSKFCEKYKLPYISLLMFGAPCESIETINDTYRNITITQPTFFGIVPGIRIYPQTQLYEIAIKEGEITPDTDILYPHFYKKELMLKKLYPHIKNLFNFKNALYK